MSTATKQIGFTPEMIQAIRDKRKTQTRRRIVERPPAHAGGLELVDQGDPPRWCWLNGWDGSVLSLVYDQPKFATGEVVAVNGEDSLSLIITGVRVEQVQSISEEDAIAEGYPGTTFNGKHVPWSPYGWFLATWQSIYGRESWNRNDWVWVYEFEVVGGAE